MLRDNWGRFSAHQVERVLVDSDEEIMGLVNYVG